jgi:hypothetical protein
MDSLGNTTEGGRSREGRTAIPLLNRRLDVASFLVGAGAAGAAAVAAESFGCREDGRGSLCIASANALLTEASPNV